MTPTLSEEHEHHRDAFRRFAEEHIGPLAGAIDAEERIPEELISEIGRAGLLATQISPDRGGRGLDPVAYGLLHHEFGRVCSSVRALLTVHDMVAEVVARLGNRFQREHWLPDLISGGAIGAFALTEPETGSDAGAIATVAVEERGGFSITGHKKWITFGQRADVFLVVARLGPDGPVGALMVPREADGVSIEPMRGLLGQRGGMLAEIHLDDARVDGDARVGPARAPSGLVSTTALQHGRYAVAWGCVGLGEACVEASFRYAAQRRQFGVPLQDHQLIKRKLTDMHVELQAARLMCLEAANSIERGSPRMVEATLAAKYFASRMATRVSSEAVQIHGALGCSHDLPVERLFRDARIMEIIEGSTEILQIAIAGHAAGHYARGPAD